MKDAKIQTFVNFQRIAVDKNNVSFHNCDFDVPFSIAVVKDGNLPHNDSFIEKV